MVAARRTFEAARQKRQGIKYGSQGEGQRVAEDESSVSGRVVLLVQLNDLYQIDTSADYTDETALILPRISTLVKQLRAHYGAENVRFCVPGDFLAPSCLSKTFKGEQMVDILNRIGVDFVSLGNHEFEKDITTDDFAARVAESNFKWLNLNFEFKDQALQDRWTTTGKMSELEVLALSSSHRILLFGVLNTDTPEHLGTVHEDPSDFIQSVLECARTARKQAQRRTPPQKITFTYAAMTHEGLKQDIELAEKLPELGLIMGGHDHNVLDANWVEKCLIVKAASNARTLRLNWIVAIPRFPATGAAPPDIRDRALFRGFALNVYSVAALHPLRDILLEGSRKSVEDLQAALDLMQFEPHLTRVRVEGEELIFTFSMAINTESRAIMRLVKRELEVEERIRYWNARSGHSEAPLIRTPVALQLKDARVRRCSTNFGNFVADMLRGFPVQHPGRDFHTDIGLINSGSFRVDRDIQAGEGLSDRTLCDIFYHTNSINRYRLTGARVLAILQQSLKFRNESADEGHGLFLQVSGLKIRVARDQSLTVSKVSDVGKETPVLLDQTYEVASTPYVAREAYKELFAGALGEELHPDIRQCTREVLSSLKPDLFEMLLQEDSRWEFAPES